MIRWSSQHKELRESRPANRKQDLETERPEWLEHCKKAAGVGRMPRDRPEAQGQLHNKAKYFVLF